MAETKSHHWVWLHVLTRVIATVAITSSMATVYTLPKPHGASSFKRLNLSVSSLKCMWRLKACTWRAGCFFFFWHFFFPHRPMNPKKPADVLPGNDEPTAFLLVTLSSLSFSPSLPLCLHPSQHVSISRSGCFVSHMDAVFDQLLTKKNDALSSTYVEIRSQGVCVPVQQSVCSSRISPARVQTTCIAVIVIVIQNTTIIFPTKTFSLPVIYFGVA